MRRYNDVANLSDSQEFRFNQTTQPCLPIPVLVTLVTLTLITLACVLARATLRSATHHVIIQPRLLVLLPTPASSAQSVPVEIVLAPSALPQPSHQIFAVILSDTQGNGISFGNYGEYGEISDDSRILKSV